MKRLISVVSFLFLFSCNQQHAKNSDEKSFPKTEEARISKDINLQGNDDMKYDQNEFTVKAGEEINLTFTNTGVLPIETMGHNVVILEKNADVQKFATASAKAKDTNYISDLYLTDIVAHTKLLGPGKSETITFTLKEKGEYTFICTFPGHWIAMRGIITAI